MELMFGKMDDVKIDFKQGLVPCIIQDSNTRVVLMLGFMNDEAFTKTIKEGKVTFFSRSKNRLWTKGETSGNFLHVVDIKADCDNDTLLITVNPEGPVCHTGADTCFGETNKTFTLKSLEAVIQNRKMSPSPTSYTTHLLESGINKIAQKVGEEAVELVIESKDENRTKFLNEAADLLFHYLVLLCAKEATLDDVVGVLRTRHEQAK
jgi:phosphoribosyl-AMP cyclohydrolase / phosphoribosyl-ATP pyrophosphohydrolase